MHAVVFLLVFGGVWGTSFILWKVRGVNLELGVTLFAIVAITCVLVGYIVCSCARRKVGHSIEIVSLWVTGSPLRIPEGEYGCGLW